MTDTLERREAIARIIDPVAWKTREAHLREVSIWQNRHDPAALAARYAEDAVRIVEPSLAKADAILALSLPAREVSGNDVEASAWAWLDQTFGSESEDPVDRAYAADEMVDAFHAGRAAREVSGERVASFAAGYAQGQFDTLATTPAPREKLEADLVEARTLLARAEPALNAAFAQADAEFRDQDKIAARHDAIVRQFRSDVRATLNRLSGEG